MTDRGIIGRNRKHVKRLKGGFIAGGPGPNGSAPRAKCGSCGTYSDSRLWECPGCGRRVGPEDRTLDDAEFLRRQVLRGVKSGQARRRVVQGRNGFILRCRAAGMSYGAISAAVLADGVYGDHLQRTGRRRADGTLAFGKHTVRNVVRDFVLVRITEESGLRRWVAVRAAVTPGQRRRQALVKVNGVKVDWRTLEAERQAMASMLDHVEQRMAGGG